jgi:hypothetical protein
MRMPAMSATSGCNSTMFIDTETGSFPPSRG